jgi:hypothetical protein
MKTIVAGSRGATLSQVRAAMRACPWRDEISTVISGCAQGADTHGEAWARLRDIPVCRTPADWKTHGKAAGPIRNKDMAKVGDALVAVWDGKSRGTANMIDEMNALYKRVFAWRTDGAAAAARMER